ncbi:cobalamin-dependent protein [bacterium]|nr:cobalamin-dependent protein [bacterium]
MWNNKPIKILIAKPGLDGHDQGAKVLAIALKNAGLEVIYSGLHQSIETIVNTAIQEDVDVIGISVMTGNHLLLTEKLGKAMEKSGIHDKMLLVGGNIPKQDKAKLKEFGAAEVFATGSKFDTIINFIREKVK